MRQIEVRIGLKLMRTSSEVVSVNVCKSRGTIANDVSLFG